MSEDSYKRVKVEQRKYESLLKENAEQQVTIERLEKENAALIDGLKKANLEN